MKNLVKGLSSVALMVVAVLASGSGAASTRGTVPDCSDAEQFVSGSWILIVNEAEQSGRDDLLAALRALSTGGFSVDGMYPADPALVIVTTFDPGYYGDNTQAAFAARDGALTALATAQGVTIHCNGRVGPFPGITIRN